ncbi:MAG TPA: energy-coupling factor ABC transporter permease [Anaerolineales bacterium]
MHYSPAPLHIPENILGLGVSIVCWIITALVLSAAISRTNGSLGEKQVPLMGVMAAFIFAAQMINFPILGGTSGHLLGGVLAAITLGPWAGMLVMTAVIAVQALLFQDGGLVVMGANILNMGLITTAIGYGLYRGVARGSRTLKLVMAGIAAWLSVLAGALFTSIEIWLSGNAQLQIVIPAMLGIHAMIGIGEALITVAALTFIFRSRPDLLGENSESAKGSRVWVLIGALISLVVVFLSPLASSDPDGLESVASELGFLQLAGNSPYTILPDYTLPFLGATPASTIIAGVVGILVVGVVIVLLGQGMKAKS